MPKTKKQKTPNRFRIDNTDHIFDVNKKLHDHDQVDLVCPQASAGHEQQPANRSAGELAQAERYIIYSVSFSSD